MSHPFSNLQDEADICHALTGASMFAFTHICPFACEALFFFIPGPASLELTVSRKVPISDFDVENQSKMQVSTFHNDAGSWGPWRCLCPVRSPYGTNYYYYSTFGSFVESAAIEGGNGRGDGVSTGFASAA